MSARGFGSILWAGAVGGAALGFYLVSLNVASERAELEEVETRIALAQRDIRILQTEIGTRGRLAQLERWNVKFIRLSAPTADQFVEGGFQLATLVAPQKKPAIEAPVVLASAPVGQGVAQPRLTGDSPDAPIAQRSASEMMHVASYTMPQRQSARPAAPKDPVTKRQAATADPRRAPPATGRSPEPAAKPVKAAMADPLAPLPGAKPKAKAGATAASAGGAATKRTLKDSDD